MFKQPFIGGNHMARRLKSAKEVREKWERNAGNAEQDYIDGVKNIEVNPAEEAIKNLKKMETNFIARIKDGTTEAGLKRVTKEDWIAKTAGKGAERYAAGVRDSGDKYEKNMGQVLDHIAKGQKEVHAMPNATDADTDKRMLHMKKHMKKFRKS